MKTKIKNNLIASVVLALTPLLPLALLLPGRETVIGALVVIALATLGYMELRNGAAAHMPRRQPRGSIEVFRQSKA
ncbi:hypothetical protein MLD52_12240 [Puniceicoccaceae bacterium K14]|nr:hypothetical protein [Puniceicoccaceae bacterium K14]